MPTPRLAVAAQKGGVGKTTVAINVAAALTDRGHDVLLVDLDPQGNATEHVGLRDAYDDDPPSLFDVLSDPDQREVVTDLIHTHPEMHVLPSNIDMTAVEPELVMSRRSGEQLDLALEYVEEDYDLIVIDTPPFLGYLMDNALYAARRVLIPALAEETSKRAFELLYDHIGQLERDYGIDITDTGVVVNRVDVRKTQANDMIAWIESAFDDTPVWTVRERAAIQKALAEHQSLLSFEPDNDQVPVFEAIAERLAVDLDLEVTA